MPGSTEYPQPYIKSGLNKGRIKDPLVAHEVYGTIENLRKRETGKRHHRVYKKPFFKRYGDDEALILQAAKNVRQEKESQIDKLTGLHRQESYQPFVEDEIKKLRDKRITGFGVIKFDFDYFSWINNNVEAHTIGDLYLSIAGNMLREELRTNDTGIRPGTGDEFVALIDNLKRKEDFEQIAKRIHEVINKRVLTKTLQTLVFGDKEILDDQGKPIREGTYAIKQFLAGLVNLRDDYNGKGTHFLDTGKGTIEEKKKFMGILRQVDFYRFKTYLEDKRSLRELSAGDLKTRQFQEQEIAGLIEMVFFNLSVSAGGLYIDRNSLTGFSPIDTKLEELVYSVKRSGGGKIFLA